MRSGRSFVVAGVLACLIGPAPRAATMAPAITMIYGAPLAKPLFVVGKEISDLHTYAFLSCAQASPGSVGELGNRSFLSIANYWDTDVWKNYLDNPSLRTELKPEAANQHGRIYFPTAKERALVVVTDFTINGPMAISGSSTGFFKSCFVSDEDAATALRLGVPGLQRPARVPEDFS